MSPLAQNFFTGTQILTLLLCPQLKTQDLHYNSFSSQILAPVLLEEWRKRKYSKAFWEMVMCQVLFPVVNLIFTTLLFVFDWGEKQKI